jgi:hypothetical protein
MRFSTASTGSSRSPTAARNGSVSTKDTVAKPTSMITAIENGTGFRTSVAA